MTQPNPDTTSKITNPQRIARILTKMCEGRMQVIIRTKENIKLGIRATFAAITVERSGTVSFDKISVFGLEKLSLNGPIKIEVMGMPTMVMFITEVLEKVGDTITCQLPVMLTSIERRQNSRFKVSPAFMAYMSFSVWQPEANDTGAAPFFEVYRSMAGWIPLVDISAGGICLSSHFPSFINALDNVNLDTQANLHLPMQNPLAVQAAIRWKRRIKNRLVDADDSERYQMDFRIGVEFAELSDERKIQIRNYLRQLSVAEAI